MTVEEAETMQIVVERLAAELAALRAKVQGYYYEELALRGDKNLMREYKDWFGIE